MAKDHARVYKIMQAKQRTSLRPGSPLSHTREQRTANQSEGKESGSLSRLAASLEKY